MAWNFDNSYLQLPQALYKRQAPQPVAAPQLVLFNEKLSTEMGLDTQHLKGSEAAALFAGNTLPDGALPLAQAYAGHQFGHFTMLGDGRAILLGEHLDSAGKRYDIQLKGSGRTPYSRRGDGRAALGPMLREYVISEAMHALGIPTTRSLAVVSTGEEVYRASILPGAILTRVAASHIRVGTFEYAARLPDKKILQTLADYTLQRHFPELYSTADAYLGLLRAVMSKQAALITKWMQVGFIHGVMNTDNMALSGETIDYGPCAFMDAYDPATVFSSIDEHGRYAFGNQPHIAQWNLARFAETLLPLLHEDTKVAVKIAEETLEQFSEMFHKQWLQVMLGKIGIANTMQNAEESQVKSEAAKDDGELIEALFGIMKKHQADYTNTFRSLASEKFPETPLFQSAEFEAWHQRWQSTLRQRGVTNAKAFLIMRRHNPAVIPRNYLVEQALKAAVDHGDITVVQRLISVLSHPYDDLKTGEAAFGEPSPSGEQPYQTFCGT